MRTAQSSQPLGPRCVTYRYDRVTGDTGLGFVPSVKYTGLGWADAAGCSGDYVLNNDDVRVLHARIAYGKRMGTTVCLLCNTNTHRGILPATGCGGIAHYNEQERTSHNK